MLRDAQGHWMEDVDDIRLLVNHYYRELFGPSPSLGSWYQTPFSFPRLDEQVLASLDLPPSNNEIKAAVFGMNPWKAPGPDGYPAGFYQKSWDVVGQDVCDFIHRL